MFRTNSDLVGMSWFSEDTLSHPNFRYRTKKDFRGTRLSYYYHISGYTQPMNAIQAPTITIRTGDGKNYYVRLWNYVVNRPLDDWEKGASTYLGETIRFPQGRSAGNATGTSGDIVIDFDNLYAGWKPYDWKAINEKDAWVENLDWVKIPVDDITEIMWSFVPQNYNEGDPYLPDSKAYTVEFTGWNVSGNKAVGEELEEQETTKVRMCDDYDDIYNLTPERVVSEYVRLGYREIVNCYIGASHYYDKYHYDGKMNVKTDKPFNQAFELWYGDYLRRLHEENFQVIHSISMECVDPPEDWKQRTWDGTAGTTNWDPEPSLLSFVNYNVKLFYIQYVKGLARLATKAGLQPMIQLGESWWWYIEDGKKNVPCFYDSATRYEYKYKYGKDMHEFKTGYDSIEGHEDILDFLRDQNGAFTQLLKGELKAAYPDALFTVLFFPPSVMDRSRVPKMMSIVNFPAEQWASPNLDFFMLEDYDYLIDGDMQKHWDALEFIQRSLGYPASKIHYFASFVLNESKKNVWEKVDQAIVDGFNHQFKEVYVWAYAQVKRDGWYPPVIVSATPRPANYVQKQHVILQGPEGSKLTCSAVESQKPRRKRARTNASDVTALAATGSNKVEIDINKSTTLYVTAEHNGRSNQYEFQYTSPMRMLGYCNCTVDGDISDWEKIQVWNGLAPIGYGVKTYQKLYAYMNGENLYIMAEGASGNQEIRLYIGLPDPTVQDWIEERWKASKINYKVVNNKLYQCTKNGTEINWKSLSEVKFAKGSDGCAEWSIPLELLNCTADKPLQLGMVREQEYVPQTSIGMAEVIFRASDEYVTLEQMKALGWKKILKGYTYTYEESVQKTKIIRDEDFINQKDVDELNKWLDYYELTEPNVLCHFLAQCMAECGKGMYFAEQGDGPYLEDFIVEFDTSKRYPYEYRGVGAIQLTGADHYEPFSQEINEIYGVEDPDIICEIDMTGDFQQRVDNAKRKGCNYVVSKYPWTVAAFYFDWKGSDLTIPNPRILVKMCENSEKQDNLDYEQDLKERPDSTAIQNDNEYQNTQLFESVRELTIAVRGGDDDKSIKDGGSVASRKVYYRMCRDVLFPNKVQSTQGDQS